MASILLDFSEPDCPDTADVLKRLGLFMTVTRAPSASHCPLHTVRLTGDRNDIIEFLAHNYCAGDSAMLAEHIDLIVEAGPITTTGWEDLVKTSSAGAVTVHSVTALDRGTLVRFTERTDNWNGSLIVTDRIAFLKADGKRHRLEWSNIV